MTQVTFQGTPVNLSGQFPKLGTPAPEFTLCAGDLSDITLASLKGKKVLLNIFPSIDTPVCAASVRAFHEKAAGLENVIILCISTDLPFATSRFCAAEGIDGVQLASFFRNTEFAEAYGVAIGEGPLRGLAARATLVIDEAGIVTHAQLLEEITNEPNYDAAIAALQGE
ncbi:thiol peroxidase [Vibrio diabolicus]|uniref:thiol peroxidase n=1 Tax=Vibrio diabolicus TaxID=50719 RepID=UPI002494F99E|nr:thiol peroxidase [Vibrio diabolicus]